MRERLAPALFLLVGFVNFLPVVGVVSAARLEALYGVAIGDPSLEVLMRHRAVLFAIVGGLLGAAAFAPRLRGVAGAAGLVSMLSFVALAGAVDGVNAAIGRVAAVDVAASLALVVALALDRPRARAGD